MGWRPASCCPRRSPLSLPVLTRGAATALRDSPRCVVPSHFPRGLRLARSPLRYRIASPTSRSEPRLLSARPLRGSALPPTARRLSVSSLPPPRPSCRMGCRPLCRLPLSPAPARSPSAVWHRRPLPPTLSVPSLPPLLLPDGLPPLFSDSLCRRFLSPPAGWAAASVSDSLCRRFPLSSPAGWAAASVSDSLCRPSPLLLPDGLLPLPPTTSIASSLCRRRPIPHAGWDVVLRPRNVRADVIPGSERSAAHLPPRQRQRLPAMNSGRERAIRQGREGKRG